MAVDRIWEVDEANTVKARFGSFGKKIVTVNGNEVYNARRLKRKGEIPFLLPDGRQAVIAIKPEFIGVPSIDLWVRGQRIIENDKTPIKCASCGTVAKSYDRFCAKCGQAMPTAEDHKNKKHLKSATGAIKVLAGLFLFFGVVMFFVTKGQADTAIVGLKLESMDPTALYTTPINGRQYTVGELRKQLEWEPWGILAVNFILAAIMIGLSFWARRSPLPAVLIATATYAVVIVANAIVDPATIGQGMIMKIIVIGLLVKGIRAALALRAANA